MTPKFSFPSFMVGIVIGLLLGLIFISISSCERIEYGEMNTYCVQEGENYSDFPKLMTSDGEIFVKVFFHKSCRARTIGPSGWNKLVGLSDTPDPHVNSARWAWRYDSITDMIKLASYMWINSEKPTVDNGGIVYTHSVPLEQWINVTVVYEHGWWKMLSGDSESIGHKHNVPGLKEPFYIEGLYFGGNGNPEYEICVSYVFGEKKGFKFSTDG